MSGYRIRSGCHNLIWAPLYSTYNDAIISWRDYHANDCKVCKEYKGCLIIQIKKENNLEVTIKEEFVKFLQ